MTVARYADTRQKATHRFPAYVYRGSWDHYFGEGMCYLIASSDADALAHPSAVAAGARLMHLQIQTALGWRNVIQSDQ